MGKLFRHWSKPTKKEQKHINSVMNRPPEPPPHVCGNCRNPFTGGRPDCPNARRTRG
jgi:hypothetical protein